LDQYLSTVIIAIITGVFSVITILIQKRQDKVIDKIDEQTMFIERERTIKQKIEAKERECDLLINDILIIILDTNLSILKNTEAGSNGVSQDVFKRSEELKKKFAEVLQSIEELRKEYQIVLDMTTQFQNELKKSQEKKK
jgi:hypothetical protein